MAIIDAQVHVWVRNSPERPWHPDGERGVQAHTDKGVLLKGRSAEFRPDELLVEMDAIGVDGAVLVPPNFEGERNDVALAAATEHPSRFAVMGRVSLERDVGQSVLREWTQQPGAFGFRVSPPRGMSADEMWTDPSCAWLWADAEEFGIPLMVKAHAHGRLDLLTGVAARHPQLRLAVDAFGLRESDKDAAAVSGVEKLCAVAEFPNISVKATSAPSYTNEGYPFPTAQRCVELLVRAFGAGRVFWGTDLTRLPCTYREALDMVRDGCEFLSPEERQLVLGDAIVDWLGWKR